MIAGLVLAWMLVSLPGTVLAQTPHQAGLVIVHGDGSLVSRCVGFPEESISGQELVSRAGLDLHMEATAMGPSVCRLDGEGCSAGSNCFCQCMSSPCVYWSYWQWDGAMWVYATLGAGSTTVADGSLEGWVWGEGVVGRNADLQPPNVAFADVCTGDNWIMDQARDQDGTVSAVGLGVQPWVWAAVIAVIPLGVGGWLLWRRRQA
jgi:hypothetical protein